MSDRIVDLAMGLAPEAGPPVKPANHLRCRLLQLLTKRFAEQLVIAIPAPRAVERDENRFERSIPASISAPPE
jgi:hypothetical protein